MCAAAERCAGSAALPLLIRSLQACTPCSGRAAASGAATKFDIQPRGNGQMIAQRAQKGGLPLRVTYARYHSRCKGYKPQVVSLWKSVCSRIQTVCRSEG